MHEYYVMDTKPHLMDVLGTKIPNQFNWVVEEQHWSNPTSDRRFCDACVVECKVCIVIVAN